MTYDEIMAMTDDELDCAGARAQEWHLSNDGCWWLSETSPRGEILVIDYHPSRDGNQLIEIMNREHISVTYEEENFWSADNYDVANNDKESVALGNTINQAVLRCYLLSKQGGNNG